MRGKHFLFGRLSHWFVSLVVFFPTSLALGWPCRICNCLSQIERSEAAVLFLLITAVPEGGKGWYER